VTEQLMGFVCDKCAAIAAGETTVGELIKEGDNLYRERSRTDDIKLLQALEKYNKAWKFLKTANGHANCIKFIDDEYRHLYRTIQGSRA